MVTYYVENMTITCSPMFRHVFGVIIIVSSDKGNIDPSKYKCWKSMETDGSHLNRALNNWTLNIIIIFVCLFVLASRFTTIRYTKNDRRESGNHLGRRALGQHSTSRII